MNLNEIESVKLPIVFISLSIILSSICFGLFKGNLWLAVICASLFFLFLIVYTNLKFTFFMLVFFVINILININFYNIEVKKSFEGNLRVTECSDYYKIAEYKGRRMYIEGNNLSVESGELIFAKGNFKSEINTEKGTIGKITIENYKEIQGDFYSKLMSIRRDVYKKLEENMGKRKAGLICSVSFGYSDYLDAEDKEEMRNLGVIHAISVSGLHVALVFAIINKLTNKRIAIGVTILYVLFTGAVFSSIRALIMGICIACSVGAKKKYNPLGALVFSAALITVIKPYAPFGLGFMLSYFATLGIILFSKKINKKLYRLPKFLRESLSLCISAQIFTLPILMISFKEVATASIIGNLIVIPILNLLIILGNLMLLVLKIPFLFDFFSYIVIVTIRVLDFIIESTYQISNSFVVNDGLVVIYILSIISLYFFIKGHKKIIALPIIAIMLVALNIYSPVVKIEYLKGGGILVSYRGDRKIITNKRNIDIARLKKENLTDNAYREVNDVLINKDIKLKLEGNNYKLTLGGKNYLLKINKGDKDNENYDIINFVEGKKKGFFIVNNKLYLY